MKNILVSVILVFSFFSITSTYKIFAQEPTPVQNPAPEQPTAIKGTKVNLIKPAGFIESTNFPGFQQNSSGATIIVTELPGPYKEVSESFTAENLKSRGMILQSTEKTTIDGYPGLIIKFSQQAYGQDFGKLGILFGDDQETIFVVASFPVETEKDLLAPLKDSILSAKWDRKKVVDPFADLTFTLDDSSSPLKFAKRVQSTLLYSKDGQFPVAVDAPIFIVGKAVSDLAEEQIADQKAFAESRLNQTVENKNIVVQTNEPITIGALSGYELVASGEDASTNTPVAIYQTILFEGKTYYIFQGVVGAKAKDQFISEFKKMTRNFKQK